MKSSKHNKPLYAFNSMLTAAVISAFAGTANASVNTALLNIDRQEFQNIEMTSQFGQMFQSAMRDEQSDMLYLEGGHRNSLRAARRALQSGKTIVIDNTRVNENAKAHKLISKIAGIGVAAPIVVLKNINGVIHFTPIDIVGLKPKVKSATYTDKGEPEQVNNDYSPAEKFEGLAHDNKMALVERTKKVIAEQPVPNAIESAGQEYTKAVHYFVHLQRLNAQCLTKYIVNDGYSGWDEESPTVDSCGTEASIGLSYEISLIRSLQSNTTPNAKFARFSLTENGAGAGFHLRNFIIHERSTDNGFGNYRTFVGPIANQYDVSISESGNANATLLYHQPKNHEPNVETTYSSGWTLGLDINAGAEVGQEGPKANGGATASGSYSQNKSVTVKTREYDLINNTSGKTASFTWRRHKDLSGDGQCQYLAANVTVNCGFTNSLFDTDGWVYDVNSTAFSPMSHSNFTPNIDVVYTAAPNEEGTSLFNLSAQMHPYVMGGRSAYEVLWYGLYGVANDWSYPIGTSTTVSVDWGSPIFETETNVMLQSNNHNDACLTPTYNANDSLSWASCQGLMDQVWGLDDSQRYHFRDRKHECLTVNNDLSLTLETCGNQLNQKWYWEKDGNGNYTSYLRSKFVDGNGNNNYYLNKAGGIGVQVTNVTADRGEWQPILININDAYFSSGQ